MKTGGRPVRADIGRWDGKQVVQDTKRGTFHCWGYRRNKDKDDKPKQGWTETVAIVELECGRIKTVKPDNITFLDRGVTDGSKATS